MELSKHIEPLPLRSPEDLAMQAAGIAASIEKDGYCLLQGWDDSVECLEMIGAHFGKAQGHIRANHMGITGTGDCTDDSWKKFPAEYQGVTSGIFPPHTDGTFLSGIYYQDGKAVPICPPKLMMLQCVRTAGTGGENIIIDGKAIFRDLSRDHPKVAKILCTMGCVTFSRDNMMSAEQCIFEKRPDGHYRMRYRFDEKMLAPAWSIDAIHFFNENYIMNPKYRVTLCLKKGNVMVIDNLRALHGRLAFTPDKDPKKSRKLRRLWILDDMVEELRPIQGVIREQRSMEAFKSYGPIENPHKVSVAKYNCGFRYYLNEGK
eukprot:g1142.t1